METRRDSHASRRFNKMDCAAILRPGACQIAWHFSETAPKLSHVNGNMSHHRRVTVSEAARSLNVSRRTIQRWGLEKDASGLVDLNHAEGLFAQSFHLPRRGRKIGRPNQQRLNLRGGTSGRKGSFRGRSFAQRIDLIQREIAAMRPDEQMTLLTIGPAMIFPPETLARMEREDLEKAAPVRRRT